MRKRRLLEDKQCVPVAFSNFVGLTRARSALITMRLQAQSLELTYLQSWAAELGVTALLHRTLEEAGWPHRVWEHENEAGRLHCLLWQSNLALVEISLNDYNPLHSISSLAELHPGLVSAVHQAFMDELAITVRRKQ